ncbi:hypothetical protein JYT19_01130, partial [Sulfobacillus acidophilus]|nr:hypothetical protein [Sulfobacillus acidophilus]
LHEHKSAILKMSHKGRFELISKNPHILLDGAHNQHALEELIRSIKKDECLSNKKMIVLFGATKGHNLAKMLQTLCIENENFDSIIFTKSKSPRSLCAQEIYDEAKKQSLINTDCIESPKCALEKAISQLGNGKFILVTGSLYLVGQIRAMLKNMPSDDDFPMF